MEPVDLRLAPDSAAIAIVTPDQAFFAFPVETRLQFHWPESSADPSVDKYAWGLTVLSADTAFLPGGQSYRADHPRPFESLAEVIRAAHAGLLFNPGSMVQMLDPRASVTIGMVAGRAVVILRGSEQVARVFRTRPATVRFGAVAPLQPTWRQTVVNVEYRPQ